jgi:hypothetical protein
MRYVEYDSNNSGGSWWLTDENWYALEKAGWRIKWNRLATISDKDGNMVRGSDGLPLLVDPSDPRVNDYNRRTATERWLGALAMKAYRIGFTLREAVKEWETITGLNSTDAGCPCCGQPHDFYEYEDGKQVDSGPSATYSCSWEDE